MNRSQATPGSLYVTWQTGDPELGFVYGEDGAKTLAIEFWASDEVTPVRMSRYHRSQCNALLVLP